MIAFLTGSGFYNYSDFKATSVSTRFGPAEFLSGSIDGRQVLILPRHGQDHQKLPHHINHRANLVALKEAGATAIVSCSVCGVLNAEWSIGRPFLAEDLHFLDNRLADGTVCSLFDTPGESGRGHLLATSLLNTKLTHAIADVLNKRNNPPMRGTYAHVVGPRFNTKTEIRQLRSIGVDFLSQTCGPEAVFANELELPYALAGFGVDFANGIKPEPTPLETLNENLVKAKDAFIQIIEGLEEPSGGFAFENFVYRF